MALMTKRYDEYCPVAHALGLVGERWALVVLELHAAEALHRSRRESRIGTNILASRLRDLEAAGVVSKAVPPWRPRRCTSSRTTEARASPSHSGACALGVPARSARRRTTTSSSEAGLRTRSTPCWRRLHRLGASSSGSGRRSRLSSTERCWMGPLKIPTWSSRATQGRLLHVRRTASRLRRRRG